MSVYTDCFQATIEALRDECNDVLLADNISNIIASAKQVTSECHSYWATTEDNDELEIPSLKAFCDKMPEKERLAGQRAAIQLWFAVSSQICRRNDNQFDGIILADVDTTHGQREITITNLETDYSKLVQSNVWGMNGYLGHASVPEWVDGFENTLRAIGFSDWYFAVEGDADHPIVRTITLSLSDDSLAFHRKLQPRKMFKEEWFRDPAKRFVRANRAPTSGTVYTM